mmetsp:Transcript_8308/g.20286  ORF Transcript_8308/g.20286 Transcript_8308/m.20286 type:complete len:202 (-) Transcript_8308:1058-1663(-)
MRRCTCSSMRMRTRRERRCLVIHRPCRTPNLLLAVHPTPLCGVRWSCPIVCWPIADFARALPAQPLPTTRKWSRRVCKSSTWWAGEDSRVNAYVRLGHSWGKIEYNPNRVVLFTGSSSVPYPSMSNRNYGVRSSQRFAALLAVFFLTTLPPLSLPLSHTSIHTFPRLTPIPLSPCHTLLINRFAHVVAINICVGDGTDTQP